MLTQTAVDVPSLDSVEKNVEIENGVGTLSVVSYARSVGGSS
jgi:hypothetical protein